MKKITLLVLLVATTFIGCKSDDDNNSFLLNAENIAGTYGISLLESSTNTTAEIAGIPVTATATVVGDTFQVDVTFNADGTYVAEGQYRITTTVTADGMTETDTEIIVLDETGSYTVNANNETISFDASTDFPSGVFNVTTFTENQLTLEQEFSQTEQGITIEGNSILRLVR